ncbi:hypothetical protein BGZ65_009074 [Modicella reniformis]|uniref:Uncharacterized protein n=1 Tax=Modicella reniformis TaxID=1440133 RepID=A0A9P6ITG6_9FUNG|nr:hypothetical protein BGZ65_009074 [Modicella reniformis]
MSLPCFVLLKVFRHLPQQLQELEIHVNSDPYQDDHHDHQDDPQYHIHCDADLFKSSGTVFNLRRLILNTNLNCFHHRMLIPLLRQCPDLEELMLPRIKEHIIELTQVLDSHCKRLHTLNQEDYGASLMSAGHIDALLRAFSRGFRQLHLCSHSWDWEYYILETLTTTATVNTIEVLRLSNYQRVESYHILGILRHCPRLRVFQMGVESDHHFGVDFSDLVVSMDEGWKCWDTLEVLTLKVHNKVAIGHLYLKEWKHRTALDARKLRLGLRTLPKLVTLDIRWSVMMYEWEFETVFSP